MLRARVRFTVEVEMDIDPGVIQMCIRNEDGWRDTYYDLDTAEKVAEHLAFNHVVNRVDDINELDGFAGFPSGAVQFGESDAYDDFEVEWPEPGRDEAVR